MRLLYLDQNIWIDLARAVKEPDSCPADYQVLENLVRACKSGSVGVALTDTNLYETYKIGQPERRAHLAYVQATLSGGLVIRGRHRRLAEELRAFWRAMGVFRTPEPSADWFVSRLFFEATLDVDDPRMTTKPSPSQLKLVAEHPQQSMFSYLTSAPDELRRAAVTSFSKGADELRARMEARRRFSEHESLAMRRRIYSAALLVDDLNLIFAEAKAAGVPWSSTTDIGSSAMRRLIADVPTFFVERELAIRLEAQPRPISENDLRDMKAFVAAVPYVDIIVAETQFANLAIQGRLGEKYRTTILKNLSQLAPYLGTP